MVRSALFLLLAAYLLGSFVWLLSSGVVRESSGTELVNVACDPTRKLWEDLNRRFCDRYEQEHGIRISVRQSHGGSGSQARAVIEGFEADVVTLALWSDTDAIRKKGILDPDWENKFPNRSLPYTSTIVFVVRRGNPKGIREWADLTRRGDVKIVVPNPKTSGNGKWAFLSAYGSVLKRGGTGNEAEEAFRRIYAQTPVLDPAARGATETFAKKGIGDVHLTWENEAYLEVKESSGELEIVYPSESVLAEPHVAVVDSIARKRGTEALAKAFLDFLYTKEAQEVIATHYYRPTNPAIKIQTADRFPAIDLFPVTPLIGPTWDDILARFFNTGGLFDRVSAGGGAK